MVLKARVEPGLFTFSLLNMDTKKHWTTTLGQAAGHPAAFAIVLLYAAFWLAFDRTSLDLNAIATLAVWTMTLFIQRSNRRDSLALHAKLDELLRTDLHARSELARLDEQEPEEIEQHRDKEVRKDFTPARRDIPARATASSTYPHSPHREMIDDNEEPAAEPARQPEPQGRADGASRTTPPSRRREPSRPE